MLGLIGKRKATPVLGLDVSSTTVKLLELSYTGDRYRVESYAVSSLPQDAVIEKAVNDVDGVASAIRSVVASSRTKLKNVAASVAHVPFVSARFLLRAARAGRRGLHRERWSNVGASLLSTLVGFAIPWFGYFLVSATRGP